MKRLYIFLITFFITLYSYSAIIEKIEYKGLESSKEKVVKATLDIKEGEVFNPDGLNIGIKKLYKLGVFADIQSIIEEIGNDKVKITFILKEFPVIKGIVISGNNKIKKEKIKEKISFIPSDRVFENKEYLKKEKKDKEKSKSTFVSGQIYDPVRIKKDIQAILNLYKEEKYMFTTVTDTFYQNDDGDFIVEYKIEEGVKAHIKEISFEGNEKFSSKKLKKQFSNTKERNLFILREGEFDQNKFNEDLKKLEDFYKDNGYLDYEMLGYNLEVKDKKKLYLNIKIKEGEKYFLRNITFSGNKVFTDHQISQVIKVKENSTFSQKKFNATLEGISSLYYEDGYIYTSINPKKILVGKDSIDYHIEITENQQAKVKMIHIKGNDKTDERVIRREMSIYPGDLFKRSLLMRSQRNIWVLGYFEDIQIDNDIDNETGDISLIFKVKEKPVTKMALGVGYGSDQRLSGYTEIGTPNLLGKGQTLNFKWEFGKGKQNFDFSFTEPWIFNYPYSLGFDFYHTSVDYTDYNDQRFGGAIRFGRPLPWLDYLSMGTRYSFQRVKITPDDYQTASEALKNSSGVNITSSLELSISRDSRDDYMHPTTGSRHSLSMEIAGGPLGGDIKYQKYIFTSEWNFPLFWKFSLTSSTKVGISEKIGNSFVPIYEKFRLGGTGIYSLRGYENSSIGVIENFYTITNGQALFLNNFQINFPIVENQIYGLFFYDAGNVWPYFKKADLSNLKRGIGTGFRMNTPMGMLGFDFGYGLDKETGANRISGFHFHFQVGKMF